MVHAPLSSHKPSRLGFSAPAACGQNHSGTLKSHQIDALHQRPVHVMAVTAVTGIFTLEIELNHPKLLLINTKQRYKSVLKVGECVN